MARVRIVKVPKALSGFEVKMKPGLYGSNGNNQFTHNGHLEAGKISQKPVETRETLGPVDREDANLEAEKGETAVINVDGMPAHFKIGGQRHSNGGTPLNLPDNSFIFSDTAKMKIKDPLVLAQFGMAPKKGGYTPAEISKKYDINKFRRVLADPDTEAVERKTAEMMIANYNEKLAKLSLAQESIKGFPQGIPVIAMPYIESMKMNPASFLGDQAEEEQEAGTQPDAETGESRYGSQVISQWDTRKYGGGLPKAQNGTDWSKDPDVGPYYRKYMEALNSKDPAKMRSASGALKQNPNGEDIDLPGLGWWPGSKQNKLADLSQILEKQANAYEKKPTGPVLTTQEQDDMSARKDAAAAFSKAWQLKEQAKKDGDPDKEIMYDDMLKELHKVHPDYKGAQDSPNAWGSRLYRKPEYTQITNTNQHKLVKPAVYYSDKEKELIADYHNKLLKPKEVVKAKEVIKAKAAEAKPVVETPVNNIIDSSGVSIEDYMKRHKLSFQEGGEGNDDLPIAQEGKIIRLKEGTFIEKNGKMVPYKEPAKGDTKKAVAQPGVKLTPEEEAARLKTAETAPEKYVSDEQYAELEDLYKKAQVSSQGNPNKKTAETLAFQKRYHELLPNEAQRIIASEKDPTNKGKTLGHGQKYDLTANEDSMFGKRTEQYWQAVKKAPKKEDQKLPPIVKKLELPAERKPFERNPPIGTNPKPYAPWWLQDIVKTSGAAADLMRVKKYEPWQATPEVRLPDATFYDPTRELAANTEQANLASQFHQAFTGPKSGAISGVQGKAMANAADIMAKYNNMNVQIANQLSSERTGIMNDASRNKANLDTQLFDKYTIANQQFDNSKNMARQNLRQSYIDAITNRAKTQALNTLYPNFYTNPITGGFVQKTGYASINPTVPHDDADLVEAEKIVKRFPGTTFNDAMKHIKGKKGTPEDTNDPDQAYLRSQGYSGE